MNAAYRRSACAHAHGHHQRAAGSQYCDNRFAAASIRRVRWEPRLGGKQQFSLFYEPRATSGGRPWYRYGAGSGAAAPSSGRKYCCWLAVRLQEHRSGTLLLVCPKRWAGPLLITDQAHVPPMRQTHTAATCFEGQDPRSSPQRHSPSTVGVRSLLRSHMGSGQQEGPRLLCLGCVRPLIRASEEAAGTTSCCCCVSYERCMLLWGLDVLCVPTCHRTLLIAVERKTTRCLTGWNPPCAPHADTQSIRLMDVLQQPA